MRDYYKNPNFYYITVPILACIWVLFASTVALRAASNKWDKQKKGYDQSQQLITKILTLDPDRLNYKSQKGGSSEFDFSTAVDEISRLCKIPSPTFRGGKAMKRRGKSTKTANIIIDIIDIQKLSQFLSQILLRWPNLECNTLTITKQKNAKDAWKAVMKFTYTFEK
jgi:hypothetical protein